ncbi:alpha carbonic anhydrase [Xylaria sp. FL0064]|nr:alpha carbonic anhydrase [Xylaria sp. FL0064]
MAVLSSRRLLLLAAAISPVFGFCGSRTHLDRRAGDEESVPLATFGYIGTGGPLMWHHLSPENAICATGSNQSPIDMVTGSFTLVPGSNLTVSLPDTVSEGATFENLGSTIEVVMEGLGGTLELDGLDYELLQFHFHHPSEHIDNGVSMPMEMHMVFSHETQLAVIGIYIDLVDSAPLNSTRILLPRSTSSAMLETIFSSIDDIATPGAATKTSAFSMTELNALLATTEFQRYSGSLTTPPCSEGVEWSVPTQKLMLSRQTFAKVRDVVGFNSRFPQNAPGMTNIMAMAKL